MISHSHPSTKWHGVPVLIHEPWPPSLVSHIRGVVRNAPSSSARNVSTASGKSGEGGRGKAGGSVEAERGGEGRSGVEWRRLNPRDATTATRWQLPNMRENRGTHAQNGKTSSIADLT